MYDHNKQYKHDIIRARAISDVDNLLPKYASIIDKICPCSKEDFTKHSNIVAKGLITKNASEFVNKTINPITKPNTAPPLGP